jgi:AI-2 transport protein TqsA
MAPTTARQDASAPARTRLQAVVVVVLVVAALKLSYHVTLPLATAAFLVVLLRPVQTWLERRVPVWVAFVGTVLVFLLVVAVIGGAFVLSLKQILARGPELAQRWEQVSADAAAWAKAQNLPVPEGGGDKPMAQRLAPLLGRTLTKVYGALALLGLVFALMLLALTEVRDFQERVRRGFGREKAKGLLETSATIASKVRRHLIALTLTSAVSGFATGVYALLVGLELAMLWGMIAFVLNYVPTLGPLFAVIPPTLFALLQFDGIAKPLIVFLGIGAIQFFIGNFVDPKIEGRVMALSPFVVLLAIVFWGWVWGVLGAFLAVPLTVALVIICQQFEGTHWVAALLSEAKEERKKK